MKEEVKDIGAREAKGLTRIGKRIGGADVER